MYQPPDVSWNKPFKLCVNEKYESTPLKNDCSMDFKFQEKAWRENYCQVV